MTAPALSEVPPLTLPPLSATAIQHEHQRQCCLSAAAATTANAAYPPPLPPPPPPPGCGNGGADIGNNDKDVSGNNGEWQQRQCYHGRGNDDGSDDRISTGNMNGDGDSGNDDNNSDSRGGASQDAKL